MRKFHSIAALCGEGLRPELQAPFDRLAIDPRSELFVRPDGMVQSGPDPISETVTPVPVARISCFRLADLRPPPSRAPFALPCFPSLSPG
jgi:hypothetical protein